MCYKIRSEINTNCAPLRYIGSKIFTNLYWGLKANMSWKEFSGCHCEGANCLAVYAFFTQSHWHRTSMHIRKMRAKSKLPLTVSKVSYASVPSFSIPIVCFGKEGHSQLTADGCGSLGWHTGLGVMYWRWDCGCLTIGFAPFDFSMFALSEHTRG